MRYVFAMAALFTLKPGEEADTEKEEVALIGQWESLLKSLRTCLAIVAGQAFSRFLTFRVAVVKMQRTPKVQPTAPPVTDYLLMLLAQKLEIRLEAVEMRIPDLVLAELSV